MACKGSDRAHKQQGCVQVSAVFIEHVAIMFVGDFLIDGPKVCRGVDIGRGGLQLLDRPF